MESLLNSYPIFEKNQVLTESELNELVAYLDQQNRLTRAKLIGTGIACGFDLQLDTSVSPMALTIFKGMGVTSEGFLITEGDCVVRRYRPYTLPTGVRYEPFEDPVTLTQDITLYELLTDDAPTLPSDVIRFLNDPAGFVNDKVVLLFIEQIDVDIKSCLTKSCDDNGKERRFNLRKLLISITDLEKVLDRTCRQTALFPDKYDLPEIIMRRALFTDDPPTPNTSNYFTFSETYINAFSASASAAPNVRLSANATIYNQLFNALRATYTDFASILSPVYGGVNPFANFPLPAWNDYINGSSVGPKYLGIQYFYDFLKDLILAYNEFRDVAFELMSECCSDMDCFPLHLMLGQVVAPDTCTPSPYRHYWVSSPVFNNQNEKLKRAISLHQRMVLMVNKFDLPTINNPSTVITPPNTLAVPIYITPSNEKRDVLSRRSIPYYYRIHEADPNLGTLEQSWDYNFKLKCLFSKGLAPLAYGNQDIGQDTDQGPVKTPLYYDTDPFDFFRIEGHIRASYLSAQAQIEKIKNDFDLPFNVIALRLSGEPYDNIAERCDFNDLRTEYGSIRIELLSLLKNVFDRFGTTEGGTPRQKAFPAFLTALVNDANTGVKNGSVTPIQIGITDSLSASLGDGSTVVSGTGTVAGTGTISTTKSDGTLDSGLRLAGTGTTGTVADAGLGSGFLAGVGISSATLSIATFPVYAPQRTMAQVQAKLNADILSLLNSINTISTQFMPFDLAQFTYGYKGTIADATPGFIQNYLGALQTAIDIKVDFIQMLDLILRSTKVKNTPELYMDLSAYWSEVVGLLERFITSPLYKSLTLVDYTFQYRLNLLKQNDMTLFSNFIKKHPGVQHQAGVKPGGTFILVYNGNPIAVDPIVRNQVINIGRNITALKAEQGAIMASNTVTPQDNLRLKTINDTLTAVSFYQTQINLGTPIQQIAIQPDQVIADFSLPYLCCCDCECDSIPHVTDQSQLNIPALAVPFYVEYNLGDYAFGKDVDVAATQLCGTSSPGVTIDIIPMLQYEDTIYRDTQVRLYLVDKFGNRVPIFINDTGKQLRITTVSPMITGNWANEPNNGPSHGTVAILYDQTFGTRQKFIYTPDP
ncbi:MAG: hypothetical protein ACXVPQ_07535, partial [Bacteroidia bacterium]